MTYDTNPDSKKQSWTLAKWAAALGFGLISAQALAYSTVELQAADRQAAIQELTEKLGYATPGLCQVFEQESEEGQLPGNLLTLECPDNKKLLLKYGKSSRADRGSTSVVELLKQKMPADQFARLRHPIGEFSFGEPGQGKGYYTVYPWIEGTSLRTWLSKLAEPVTESAGLDDQSSERLLELYQKIGALVGAAHRAVTTREGQETRIRPSAVTDPSFKGFDLLVTPEDEVIGNLDSIVPVAQQVLFDSDILPEEFEAVTDYADSDFGNKISKADFGTMVDLVMTLAAADLSFLQSYCEILGDLGQQDGTPQGVCRKLDEYLKSLEEDAEDDSSK
ncbi:MAG: hypothetical protein OXC07_11435 [Kistimonas sp.]|nr:hypothetical protein [Kistimonas sp.]